MKEIEEADRKRAEESAAAHHHGHGHHAHQGGASGSNGGAGGDDHHHHHHHSFLFHLLHHEYTHHHKHMEEKYRDISSVIDEPRERVEGEEPNVSLTVGSSSETLQNHPFLKANTILLLVVFEASPVSCTFLKKFALSESSIPLHLFNNLLLGR